MKKGFDYSLERSRQLGMINMLITRLEKSKPKGQWDSDCREIATICGDISERQGLLDQALVENNDKLRKLIVDDLTSAGFDVHDIDEIFIKDYKMPFYEAGNTILRQYLNNKKKADAAAAKANDK